MILGLENIEAVLRLDLSEEMKVKISTMKGNKRTT